MQTRKRLSNALKVILHQFQALSFKFENTKASEVEELLLIVDELIAIRNSLHQIETEARGFVQAIKHDIKLSDGEIYDVLTKQEHLQKDEDDYAKIRASYSKIRTNLKKPKITKEEIGAARKNVRESIRFWITALQLDWIPTLDPSFLDEEGIPDFVPESVLKIVPKQVKSDIMKAQWSFNYSRLNKQSGRIPFFEASGVYLRKALATALDIKFKQSGKETELRNSSGEMFKLKKIISKSENEQFISTSIKTQLMGLKLIGDIGAHDYRIELDETDIEYSFRVIRFVLEQLFRN